jgi:hypothetical protein
MDFSLRAIDLYWIRGDKDDVKDLCLHGRVAVKIGDEVLDDGAKHSWTISAGALRMLHSLKEDHFAGEEQHLLPCCGHFMFVEEKTNRLIICGCSNGIDWSVIHDNKDIKLITQSGKQTIVPYQDYKATVLEFADQVEHFYESCSAKVFEDDFEKEGYNAFWTEWHMLRNV